MHILLVEDEPEIAYTTAFLCETYGYLVTRVANGEEALEQLSSSSFDLLLVDRKMPIMDGLQLVRALRSTPRYATLPIIGISAYVAAQAQEEWIHAGINELVLKPFDFDALAALMEALVNRVTD